MTDQQVLKEFKKEITLSKSELCALLSTFANYCMVDIYKLLPEDLGEDLDSVVAEFTINQAEILIEKGRQIVNNTQTKYTC